MSQPALAETHDQATYSGGLVGPGYNAAGVMGAGTNSPATATTAAATGGYPWSDAPCQWGGTGSCKNYDWYWDENGNGKVDGTCDTTPASSGCFDQWGYEYRNRTSWVLGRLSTNNGYKMPFAIGNANQWDNYFSGKVPLNGTPKPGAIAQTDAKSFDHVAYVEAVSSDGKQVEVSDYNNGLTGAYDLRRVATTSFTYIHFKDLPTPTTAALRQRGPCRQREIRAAGSRCFMSARTTRFGIAGR